LAARDKNRAGRFSILFTTGCAGQCRKRHSNRRFAGSNNSYTYMSTTSGLISLQSRRQVGGGCSNNGGGYDFDLTLMFPSLKSTAIYTAPTVS